MGKNADVLKYGEVTIDSRQIFRIPRGSNDGHRIKTDNYISIKKHIKGSKERLFIRTKIQSVNFRSNPLYQATKRHLNDS